MKSEEKSKEAKQVFANEVNITVEGKRHLGAVIGSKEYKHGYCNEKVSKWGEELHLLSQIAGTQPHAAYTVFTKYYRSKLTYFLRTIPAFEDYLDPIDEILNSELIPTLFGQEQPFPREFRDLFTLTPNLGGLGIISPKSESPQQYSNSVLLTKSHVEAIKHQSTEFTNDETEAENAKKQVRLGKGELLKAKVQGIDAELEAKTKRMVDQARDTGASSWLDAIPLEERGLCLNKEEFRDAVRLRYDMPLKRLPSHCVCGERFSVSHAQSCKKGGFIARRHDGIRDLLTTLVSKVCKNV